METNHTKGKWDYANDGIFDENGDQIVSLLKSEQQYFKTRRENMANGKLISAAPDLLEVAQMFDRYFNDSANSMESLSLIQELTQKAIKKAIEY